MKDFILTSWKANYDEAAPGSQSVSVSSVVTLTQPIKYIKYSISVPQLNLDLETHKKRICPCCFEAVIKWEIIYYGMYYAVANFCAFCNFSYLTKKDDYPLLKIDGYYFDYLEKEGKFRMMSQPIDGVLLELDMKISNMNEMLEQCKNALKGKLFL